MSQTSPVLYEELRPAEFIERINQCPIAYLPLGTLEWHSLHLPLGADGIQSRGVFCRLAEEIGGIVMPMLFLGPDRHERHAGQDYFGMDLYGFPEGQPEQLEGSAYWIDDDLFIRLLDTILANISRAGFKMVVAHGHGPSTDLFANQAALLGDRYHLKLLTLFDLGYKDKRGLLTDHAAMNETSLMLAMRPDLVETGKLASDADLIAIWGEDPRQATAAAGEQIIAMNIRRIRNNLQKDLDHWGHGTKIIRHEGFKRLVP